MFPAEFNVVVVSGDPNVIEVALRLFVVMTDVDILLVFIVEVFVFPMTVSDDTVAMLETMRVLNIPEAFGPPGL
jgi:hypothetical protein